MSSNGNYNFHHILVYCKPQKWFHFYFYDKFDKLNENKKQPVAKILNYGTELTIKQREDNQYIVMPKYQCKLLQFLYCNIFSLLHSEMNCMEILN